MHSEKVSTRKQGHLLVAAQFDAHVDSTILSKIDGTMLQNIYARNKNTACTSSPTRIYANNNRKSIASVLHVTILKPFRRRSANSKTLAGACR